MTESNKSAAKMPTEVVKGCEAIPANRFARRRTYSRRILFFIWLIFVFVSGGAIASHSDLVRGIDSTRASPNRALIPLTGSESAAHAITGAFTGCTSAHIDLLGDGAELLTGQETEQDRREEEDLVAIHALPTTRGMLLILPGVVFRPRERRLSASALRELEPLAHFLIKHPERAVEIDGFADGQGYLLNNQSLSLRRAETVKSALVSRGVTASQIDTRGYGTQAPVASDSDPVGRLRNRRIEIIIGRKHATIPGWSDL
jgi:outer membrane protein OmpA-like peptidoglycan-associated protein